MDAEVTVTCSLSLYLSLRQGLSLNSDSLIQLHWLVSEPPDTLPPQLLSVGISGAHCLASKTDAGI